MIDFLMSFSVIVLELNRLLGTRFVPGHPSATSPLGASLSGVLAHHNSGNYNHRDYELQKLQFLVQNLQQLEKSQPDLKRHYSKTLRRTGSSDSFFGARFEVNIASSLLKKGIGITKRERPDFLIQNSNIAIECTSVRLRTAQAKKDFDYKINATLSKKAAKGYASRSTALFVDYTNVAHNSRPFDPEKFRHAAIRAGNASPFGAIVLFNYLMNKDLNRFESTYVRINHSEIGGDLLAFLNAHYSSGAHRVHDFSLPYEG